MTIDRDGATNNVRADGARADWARTYWQTAAVTDTALPPLAPDALDDATFRLLADTLPTLCWIANGDGYIVWYNRRWYEYTGTTPDQMEGWGWQAVHDPDCLPDVMTRWQASITSGEPFEMTFPLRGADGVFRPFLTRVVPVRDASGAVARWCGVNTKISGQVAAEHALREQGERLRQVIEGATDHAILTLDCDRRVTSWSPGAALAFGWTADEIVGRSADLLFTPEDRAAGQPERETEIARREGVAADVRWHLHKDGSRVFLNGSLRPLHDAGGTHIGFHKIARDETERQRRDEALRETEERYRLAARATNDAIWDWRMADGHVVWNDAVEALFGHGGRETSADWWIEQIHPDDRDRISRSIHAVIDGAGENWSDDYRFRRADGSYAHVFDRGTVLRDEGGRAVRMIGAMLDVTERQRMTAALQASEERYRTLFETMDEGFCVIEMIFDDGGKPVDYLFVEINPAFVAQSGMPADAAGRRMLDMVPTHEKEWFDIYGEVARTGEPVRFQQGSAALGRWFDLHAFRVGAPEQARVAVLFGDITDRVKAAETLRRVNETLEVQIAERTAERDRLWDTSDDLMLIIDFQGVFRRVNPAWTALLGYTPDEVVGHHVNEFTLAEDHEKTDAAVEAAAAGNRLRVENRYRHKDGSTRWISWSAAPAGEMTYATGRDITADKAREAELEQAQEQLRQAQKMEAVGQLTGGIAHDFNNLLTGVIGSLDMMQRRLARGETDKVDRYATAAITSANRAAALTHRLLAFSRRQPLDPKPVSANKLVSGMEELLRRTIGESVRLEIVTAGGLWQTLCDPHQLESAILNLAINARDAMPQGGQLTIETCNAHLDNAYAAQQRDVTPGQYICICVTDTGTGMNADVIAKAFEPFFTTKPIGQGTGLGLSMIYGFARQSEGYAKIYSEEGRGTTVKLYLPRYYGEAEDAESAAGELTDAHRSQAGEVVLVVEDETAVRDLVVDVLGDLGYRAVEAVDGPSGLKLLQSDMRVDLLVTDVGLPGLNGRQLADFARAHRPDLKVLFMTGYAENATIANGFLEPGMEMITKPFAIEALATRIRDMIEDG